MHPKIFHNNYFYYSFITKSLCHSINKYSYIILLLNRNTQYKTMFDINWWPFYLFINCNNNAKIRYLIEVIFVLKANGNFGSNNAVTNLTSTDKTLTTIDLNWSNPNVSFDSLTLHYLINETNSSFSVNLKSNANNYTLKSLQPGSTVLITISTVVNGSVAGMSDQLNAYSGIITFNRLLTLTLTLLG